MSTVLAKHDPDLITDLEILALQEPGKGPALQRCLDRAGLTHRELANKLGYETDSESGRSTVSMWCNERRWPPQSKIREILVHLNIDRKLLLDKFGVALGTEVTPASESRQMLVNLRNEMMFEFEEFERRDIIFTNTAEKVLLFQAFKAFDDTRAAQLFFERFDKHVEEKRKRQLGTARNVTPQQSAWAGGQGVYEQGDTTTGGGLGQHNEIATEQDLQVVDSEEDANL